VLLLVITSITGYLFVKVNNVAKIGVVDNAVLLSHFSDAIVAGRQFDEEKKRWQQNVTRIEDSVKVAFESMKQNYNEAKPEQKKLLEQNLQKWNEEFSRYTRTVDKMSKEREKELMQPVLERLNSFVKVWAKRNGYQVVIGTGGGGVVLSAADQVNITDKIIEDLKPLPAF
jgi:Skp family chaperone for outer membrane proteins